jgi:mitogen-activated protein kinase 15
MHSGDLLHRDMKPSNVLLNSDCHVKLCDFGLARSVADVDDDKCPVLTDYVATRWYRAPEILLGSPRYTKGVDMWSVGCILGELLGGQPLFPGSGTMNQLERIIEVTGRPSAGDLKEIRSRFSASMLESLNVKPQKALTTMFPSASADAIDLLGKLLQFNPDRRINANTALRHPYLVQFHNDDDEPTLNSPITISINDNKRYQVADYRKYLYRKIIAHKKELRRKQREKKANSSNRKMKTSASSTSVGSAKSGRSTPVTEKRKADSRAPSRAGGHRPASKQQ